MSVAGGQGAACCPECAQSVLCAQHKSCALQCCKQPLRHLRTLFLQHEARKQQVCACECAGYSDLRTSAASENFRIAKRTFSHTILPNSSSSSGLCVFWSLSSMWSVTHFTRNFFCFLLQEEVLAAQSAHVAVKGGV